MILEHAGLNDQNQKYLHSLRPKAKGVLNPKVEFSEGTTTVFVVLEVPGHYRPKLFAETLSAAIHPPVRSARNSRPYGTCDVK